VGHMSSSDQRSEKCALRRETVEQIYRAG
jgi:hypothetical protein